MGNILIVGEGSQFREQLPAGYAAENARGAEGARVALSKQVFDAVLIGEQPSAEVQHEVQAAVQAADPEVAIVVAGGASSPDAGAWEVLKAPFSAAGVRSALVRATQQTRATRENRQLKEKLARQHAGPSEAGPPTAETAATPGNGHRPELHWIESLPARLDLRELLGAVEKSVIERTLAATEGAQAEAARRLGLSRSDLSYKLSKYDLRKPR